MEFDSEECISPGDTVDETYGGTEFNFITNHMRAYNLQGDSMTCPCNTPYISGLHFCLLVMQI
jgi:hypothetical protein